MRLPLIFCSINCLTTSHKVMSFGLTAKTQLRSDRQDHMFEPDVDTFRESSSSSSTRGDLRFSEQHRWDETNAIKEKLIWSLFSLHPYKIMIVKCRHSLFFLFSFLFYLLRGKIQISGSPEGQEVHLGMGLGCRLWPLRSHWTSDTSWRTPCLRLQGRSHSPAGKQHNRVTL